MERIQEEGIGKIIREQVVLPTRSALFIVSGARVVSGFVTADRYWNKIRLEKQKMFDLWDPGMF